MVLRAIRLCRLSRAASFVGGLLATETALRTLPSPRRPGEHLRKEPSVSTASMSRRVRVQRRRPRQASALDVGGARRAPAHEGLPKRLGTYADARGRARELVALPVTDGSSLVVDRCALTLGDRRLVARLDADEPPANARLVSRHYLQDEQGRWCRPLRSEDLLEAPAGASKETFAELCSSSSVAVAEHLHELRPVPGRRRSGSRPELRWCRRPRQEEGADWEPMALRALIGSLESYEPVRSLTARAIELRDRDASLSIRQLGHEHRRLCASAIVLNRALREAVQHAIERDGTSMSEIALRCGAVKHDQRGRSSGETSWLARRVGLMAEGGAVQPTPWVHSDVLALIARKGLRVSPREVEVP